MVVAKPLCVLPVEGDDVRPHVAGVVIQFVHDGGEVNGIIVTEETVLTETLRSRPQGDVLGVASIEESLSQFDSSASVMSADAVAFVGCEM